MLLLLLVACFGTVKTEFPPGLEPLEDNLAPWPPEGEEHLEHVQGSRDGYDWVHARGWVRAPVDRVYDALLVPDVLVNRREVDEWTWEWDVEPEYPHSLVLHNAVYRVITVEFDVTWRAGAVQGSEAHPEVVALRFQKTDGSPVIERMEGSLVLLSAGDHLTGFEVQERLSSLDSNHETIRSTLQDLHASVLAELRGEPLPDWERRRR